jgi:hypothetical protein
MRSGADLILRHSLFPLTRVFEEPRVNIITQPYSHDRTVVTVIVLLCGTALLWRFGDQAQIVALVSSGWTLTLTFWFRIGTDAE